MTESDIKKLPKGWVKMPKEAGMYVIAYTNNKAGIIEYALSDWNKDSFTLPRGIEMDGLKIIGWKIVTTLEEDAV